MDGQIIAINQFSNIQIGIGYKRHRHINYIWLICKQMCGVRNSCLLSTNLSEFACHICLLHFVSWCFSYFLTLELGWASLLVLFILLWAVFCVLFVRNTWIIMRSPFFFFFFCALFSSLCVYDIITAALKQRLIHNIWSLKFRQKNLIFSSDQLAMGFFFWLDNGFKWSIYWYYCAFRLKSTKYFLIGSRLQFTVQILCGTHIIAIWIFTNASFHWFKFVWSSHFWVASLKFWIVTLFTVDWRKNIFDTVI